MLSQSELYLGASAAWVKAKGEVDALAASDLPLVLLGPTGCGKSVLAGYVHQQSKRSGALVEHTLGSVPDALSYSAFLGHTRGAYTGAIERRVGVLQCAEGGTLFLDEMGIATPEIQRLLLGLLEGRPFTPLGASRPVAVDVRLLFATNAEPEALVAERKWHADFYYRLGGNFIRLPGLVQRRVDILPLADLFLLRKLRALSKPWRPRLSAEVEDLFLRHPWPGNIRQLQSVCERAAALMQIDRKVEVYDLTPEFLRELTPAGDGPAPDPVVSRVHAVLRRHHGNKTAAARELGMPRTHLYRFLERHPGDTPSGGFTQPA
jgi:two-component system, NtrC family, nitrogen regulation response regulator GlnG